MGHVGDGFLRVNDPTNSVKALKEDRFLRIRLQSHQVTIQVHPTMLTIIQLCSIKFKKKTKYKHKHTNKSMHSEMGPV